LTLISVLSLLDTRSGVWHRLQFSPVCFPSRAHPVSRWSKLLRSHFVIAKSSPLCSEWQVTHSRLDPALRLYEACNPLRARMRQAISVWQSRHLNVRCPVETSWHVVQFVMPLIDWWARDSGPGEIWAAAGINVHTIVKTIHPRNLVFVKVKTRAPKHEFETVVLASVERLISDLCNRSALYRRSCRNRALRKTLASPERPVSPPYPGVEPSTVSPPPHWQHHPLRCPATHKAPASACTPDKRASRWWR
jgi:hypothetical protein